MSKVGLPGQGGGTRSSGTSGRRTAADEGGSEATGDKGEAASRGCGRRSHTGRAAVVGEAAHEEVGDGSSWLGRNSPEHRRRCPPRPPPRRHGPQDMTSLPIPDELLAEIFVRLPTPTDLVRASAACVSFRRVVADRSFLRQFRKLHAPPLLGFLGPHTGFDPAERPHPSASAATAVALAADFSFSFLPAPDPAHHWVVWDVRDGRVLLRGMPLEQRRWCATLCTGGTSCFPQSLTTLQLAWRGYAHVHARFSLFPTVAMSQQLLKRRHSE